MNRMIGTNVLGYFMAGVYHRPKAEERIFLFVDLEGSTQLAERLGSARYFELLRRFVDDLTEPVLETRGEIDQLPPRDSRSMPSARAWTSSSPVRCRAGDPAAGRRGDTMRGSRAAGQGGARGRLGPRSRSGRLTRRRGRMRSISPSRLRRRGPGR
jgi:hypothetical protein